MPKLKYCVEHKTFFKRNCRFCWEREHAKGLLLNGLNKR